MIDYSYETAGIKVRATEPEVMGSLIELDLRGLQVTTDGTYLVTSKALQSVGDWSFGIDQLQAQKEGKPAPEKGTAPRPSETLAILGSLMSQLPPLLEQIRAMRVSDPIEKGFSAATAKVVEELTTAMLHENEALKSDLRDVISHSFEHLLGDGDDDEQEEEDEGPTNS
jgi:hypothetical protein